MRERGLVVSPKVGRAASIKGPWTETPKRPTANLRRLKCPLRKTLALLQIDYGTVPPKTSPPPVAREGATTLSKRGRQTGGPGICSSHPRHTDPGPRPVPPPCRGVGSLECTDDAPCDATWTVHHPDGRPNNDRNRSLSPLSPLPPYGPGRCPETRVSVF